MTLEEGLLKFILLLLLKVILMNYYFYGVFWIEDGSSIVFFEIG
jgi:hypothetical protein